MHFRIPLAALCTAHWTATVISQHSSSHKHLKSLNHIPLFATPWTAAYQVPPSIGFSRQEHWSGLPFPSSGDLPNPGIEPRSPALQVDTLPSELQLAHKHLSTQSTRLNQWWVFMLQIKRLAGDELPKLPCQQERAATLSYDLYPSLQITVS